MCDLFFGAIFRFLFQACLPKLFFKPLQELPLVALGQQEKISFVSTRLSIAIGAMESFEGTYSFINPIISPG
jgi:hypothetical protein